MAAVPTSSLSDNQRQELLCTYAALILSDEGMEMSAENIQKLVSAAGASVEPYMPGLFARALKGHKVEYVSFCFFVAVLLPCLIYTFFSLFLVFSAFI